MANIPLKTIKFPGLDDTYTVPQVDNTLSVTGAAADAKKTGDELTELNERLDNIKDRKYLFIGDSYAEGYSHDGNNSGWCRYLVECLGLSSDKYEIVYQGGYGFANGGYASLLASAVGTGFTDIVVCGGYNDNTSSEAQILSHISSFKTAANTKYPKASIHIGFIAYNKKGNGTGAIEDWETKRKNLLEIVLPAYQKCPTLGCNYLNNVECWLREDGLTPSDGYHPSAIGNQCLANAIANALTTGSAPLPNERYEITNEIKTALLHCFETVSWGNATDPAELYSALVKALHVNTSRRREELPDDYEQVEYIKSTREQYIVLNDILSGIPYSIAVKASVEQTGTSNGGYLVSGLGSSTQRFYAVTYTNQKIAARIGNNSWLELGTTTDAEVGEVYQIEMDISYTSGGNATLNMEYDKASGSVTLTAQSISGVENHALTLFAVDTAASVKGSWALYEITIYSGQNKLFDGIPCYRKSDNKTGMFNAVNNTFYPNATSTEFVVGNVIE